ncbi:diadenylate cyclase CdaA [Aliifodinibius sp. S!AR15-10]|uniref:diadenylate cyclase CdaA n=1 Tax=Aliifodinibius sp. S!AR15-10 TaxID=2950437 RepID=UPI00285F1F0E|nr:diadenylate cyclase CdaA [Aliifodinibius sp. S!AR15-10]MDR8390531.1 diadenylate cyclase CdaA [Aliifodinibius sp. S!AR15-10]
MTELVNSLQTFAQNVRIVDFLDVAVISLILYLLLNWFRKSASRRTITSLLVLVGVYILARITEMYLTEIFIEGLFIFILIGLVVVFQSDIRRLIDQLGRWRFRRSDGYDDEHRISDTIAEAASEMAKNKTGALIVIKGAEDWERHINGGIEIHGDISLSLLHSIFNPTAPGHDGAVLVENRKIIKFGAHLPLSTRLHKISKGGTRHAAALGLSEQCDALVVVVSEERGVISIAQGGQLQQLESASELKEKLLAFEKEYHLTQTGNSHRLKQVNWRTAITSVGLAVLLWFAIAYNADTIYRTYAVPIEYRNLNSSNVVLQDSVPIEARVTLFGPEQAFELLNPSQLVISFNLDSQHLNSDSLVITENNLNLPSDLDLYNVTPRSLKITSSKLTQATVPIKVPRNGTLPSQYRLQSIRPEPTTVTLLLQRGQKIDSVAVKPIDLSSVTGSTTVNSELILPESASLPKDSKPQIVVHITVEEKKN